MKTANTGDGALANPHSIRWRLPLSYAGIALLAALVLGGLLLFTLQNHYNKIERQYLEGSARAIAHSVEPLYLDRALLADDVFQSAANIYSFVAQARVRLLDVDHQLIADSGTMSEQNVISVDVRGPVVIEGEPPPNGEFETFLSIRRDWPAPAVGVSAGRENAPRYPIGLPRGAMDRFLTGVISDNEHADLTMMVSLYDANGALLGYLELSEGPAFGREIVKDVAENAIVAGLAAVLLAGVAGWLASRQISQPVLSLADATRLMAEGDLSVRVTLDRRDELGLLARTFNTMAERVETTVIMLKRFVADAAHEINTPITALRTNLELAAGGAYPDDLRADVMRAQVELERLETLTQGLLTLSRLEAHSTEPVCAPLDMTALGRQMHERYASRAEQAGINLAVDVPPDPVVIQADRKQIIRVLENLLDNALKFTPPGGTVTLELAGTPDSLRLSVTDTGIGIPEEDLPKLFSRFHRGRNAAAYPGHGLGLVITKAIVEDHGGQIEVESHGEGTHVAVTLPRERKEMSRPS
jgi:two-component system sensor histidine kinase BaeS